MEFSALLGHPGAPEPNPRLSASERNTDLSLVVISLCSRVSSTSADGRVVVSL